MTVSDNVKYAGVADPTLDLFESQYEMQSGMLYNSYVILDEKIAILDTVDKRATDEWLKNVKDILGEKVPDYLVIHHLEPDHSAGILMLHDLYPKMKLVGNMQTFRLLPQFFDTDLSALFETVTDGGELNLGEHTLKFFTAPMVHWPEVMVSFETKEGILFSADAFGKFGTETDTEDWTCEGRRYYFNIVGKYGTNVQALLKKLTAAEVIKNCKMICSLHGPVLKEDLGFYIGLYDTWSSYKPEDEGILIACASIHGNTMKAAEYLKAELEASGAGKVILTDVCRADVAKVVEDAFRYDRMVLMASSYDAGLFPPMETFLHHLVSKKYCNRKVSIVQNGTWGPTAAKCMQQILEPCQGIEYIGDVITIKTTMSESNREELKLLAKALI
ncbi:MAG: FprA family A-type flavoprotein [Lachnospiraceae bacterium]|nr:FprA family A-type flavoprotein [Lachnospiraceae bacterium]